MRIAYIVVSLQLLSTSTSVGAQESQIYRGHPTEVTSLVFGPKGDRIYSTSLKEDRIWDVESGKTLGFVSNQRGHAIALSPSGEHAVIAGFQATSLFDLSARELVWSRGIERKRYSLPFLHSLVFSPDGNSIATSGSSAQPGGRHGNKGAVISLIDPSNGKDLRIFETQSTVAETLAFSPDGKLLAAGTEGVGGELPETGELIVLDIATGEIKHRLKHVKEIKPGKNRCSVSGVAFHPSGKEIAIASSDGTVRVWDLQTETIRLTLEGHQNEVLRVAYSPDGTRLASVGKDRTVRIWDSKQGMALESLPIDCKKVNAVVFSPDGRWLAAGGGDFLRSGTIQLWESPFGED